MLRRNFINSIAVGSSIAIMPNEKILNYNSENKFNLNYAPHFGMFKHSAGEGLIDQLKFIADLGFTAFEDNNLKKRSISDQEKMASTMAKRNINMGVFVAHSIYWKEPNLASGNLDKREEFLKEIRESVEVAKRVNAKWMTVVPGHRDLRLNISYQQTNVIDSLKYACDILSLIHI